MKFFKQIRFLLSPAHKRELFVLSMFLLIGMLLETGGIGILLPALSFLLNTDLQNHPSYAGYIVAIFGHISTNGIIILGLSLLFLFYLLKSAFLLYSSYRQSHFANNLSVDFSRELFNGYLRMPYSFHLQRNSAELQRNIQIEILHFGGISLAAMTLATEVTTIFGISVLLLFLEPLGAIAVISFFGIFAFFFNRVTNARITGWGYKRQEYDGLANKYLLEGLGGVKQVKLSHLENFFLEKFIEPNKGKAKTNTKIQVMGAAPRLYLELLAVAGVALFIMLMLAQHKPLAKLVPILGIFMAAAFRLIPSINKIMTSIQTINFAESVLNVLTKEFGMIRNNPHEIINSDKQIQFKKELTVRSLGYTYPDSDRKALHDISFTIQRGEFIGFVGSTGSGKSTLIDLLVGLLSPGEGMILADSIDISEYIHQWQNMVGYVPQTIYLTDDNLRRNIAFGIPDRQIDEVKLDNALRTAQLSSFIQKLPDGLNTVVGERGVRLSGGERQRIGIARALYNDPPVLILDEATSSLDNNTENEFMQAVNALQGIKTIIIVAHRLSTIEKCDRIFELKNGEIIRETKPAFLL